MTFRILLALVATIVASSPARAQDKGSKDVVKVFVLAGQSNMEGKAKNSLLEHQSEAPETKKLFAHLKQGGRWIVRDDAFIKYLKRKGPLTIGYGSRDRTGVELEFGNVVADHYTSPVLLIKAAWGGHSLIKLFRSPSAGLPPKEKLEKELADATKRVRNRNEKRKRSDPLPTMDDVTNGYGSSYRNMMKEIRETMAGFGEMFPKLRGKKLELAGFVWFQGWNDQYGGAEREYAKNLGHFITDVRKELDAPDLPFVIGVMGQNGSKPAMLTIQEAQLGMEKEPRFRSNVKAVRTDALVDKAAEKLYPHWRKRFKEWEKTGSDFAYHYLGSAIWFNRMGRAFGEAMLDLLKKR